MRTDKRTDMARLIVACLKRHKNLYDGSVSSFTYTISIELQGYREDGTGYLHIYVILYYLFNLRK